MDKRTVMVKVYIDSIHQILMHQDNEIPRLSLNSTSITDPIYQGLLQEVKVMRTLYHPNIIKFYHEIHMKDVYGYVMEYCQYGTLHDRIQKDGPLTEKQIQDVMKQMLSALVYLIEKRIIHRYV